MHLKTAYVKPALTPGMVLAFFEDQKLGFGYIWWPFPASSFKHFRCPEQTAENYVLW